MSAHGHADDGYHFAHPMPVPMLLAVFAVLTVLTIITVAQSNFNIGSMDVVIVMVIATIKATLVGAFFMHLAWDKPFNILMFVGSFVFVGLFVIFTLGDSRMTAGDLTPVDDGVPNLAEMAEAAGAE
jgi:cytochrome c oxidase subunit 4